MYGSSRSRREAERESSEDPTQDAKVKSSHIEYVEPEFALRSVTDNFGSSTISEKST